MDRCNRLRLPQIAQIAQMIKWRTVEWEIPGSKLCKAEFFQLSLKVLSNPLRSSAILKPIFKTFVRVIETVYCENFYTKVSIKDQRRHFGYIWINHTVRSLEVEWFKKTYRKLLQFVDLCKEDIKLKIPQSETEDNTNFDFFFY